MTTEHDNAQKQVGRKRGNMRRISGILLAVIGLYWLALKAGWMQIQRGQGAIFWLIVAIAAGLLLFLSSGHRHTT